MKYLVELSEVDHPFVTGVLVNGLIEMAEKSEKDSEALKDGKSNKDLQRFLNLN
jgi:hypothetical protein